MKLMMLLGQTLSNLLISAVAEAILRRFSAEQVPSSMFLTLRKVSCDKSPVLAVTLRFTFPIRLPVIIGTYPPPACAIN